MNNFVFALVILAYSSGTWYTVPNFNPQTGQPTYHARIFQSLEGCYAFAEHVKKKMAVQFSGRAVYRCLALRPK